MKFWGKHFYDYCLLLIKEEDFSALESYMGQTHLR